MAMFQFPLCRVTHTSLSLPFPFLCWAIISDLHPPPGVHQSASWCSTKQFWVLTSISCQGTTLGFFACMNNSEDTSGWLPKRFGSTCLCLFWCLLWNLHLFSSFLLFSFLLSNKNEQWSLLPIILLRSSFKGVIHLFYSLVKLRVGIHKKVRRKGKCYYSSQLVEVKWKTYYTT